MRPELWARIEEIVQSAIDCPSENRPALIDAACGDDAELRRDVESLMALNEDGAFTSSPGFADAVKILEQRNAKLNEDRRIGAYRILREIGRGGMGTVYLAARDDDAFHKLVAIKIIRRGLDSDDIIRRFHGERRILAMLDHPNIARLLDGGSTDDGLPYFVMEYIEGEPIDVYCDSRNLTVTERLKLFQGVCAAVRYAHQNLVVHRDIKPGNVLVTKEGVPRLLDFGIAKALAAGTAAGLATQTAFRPLTPEYASPEQIRGEPITTASDVYSLGVLLYLLLTGHSPYGRMSSPAEIERAICEKEPERPSFRVMRGAAGPKQRPARIGPGSLSQTREGSPGKLRRRLDGDLDNIVLMALRKEPQRRYTSAEQLSEDIARHLANRPVIARAETLGYRAAKFIRRNRAWVAVAALIFLILAGGIAATLWQAHAARRQRQKAARINAFLQEMVGYSAVTAGSANHNAHDATVAEMLDDAAQRVETELADQPEVKAEMLGTVGGTYMAQAKYELALRYLRQAYDLNLKLYGSNARQTAAVMLPLGDLSYLKGDYADADSWFQKAMPIYRRHANDEDFELRLLVGMLSDAAFVKKAVGRPLEAEALWREALAYGPRLPSRYRGQSIVPKTFLAQLYLDRGDIEKADALASEASRELRAFGLDRVSLAQSLIDLGNIRSLQERYADADALLEEGTNLYAKAQGDGHPNVAYGWLCLADSNYRQARYDAAEQDIRQAQAILEKLPNYTRNHGRVNTSLGMIFVKTGRLREAEPLLRKGLAIAEQKSPRQSNYVAAALGGLGECLTVANRYAEAEPLLTESYKIIDSLHVPKSPTLKEARGRLATLYAAWGKGK
jgi:serine/threonine protein kinase